MLVLPSVGLGKLWCLYEKRSFQNFHSLDILKNVKILDFPESPELAENKGKVDHFPEIVENLEFF